MRRLALLLLAAVPLLAQAPPAGSSDVVLGRLLPSGKLQATPEQLIALNGDADTLAVLHDRRVAGLELELHGHFDERHVFQVDPRHMRAMFARKEGKRYAITYWCEVCSIRTYVPGLCVCCQGETKLDLRDPNLE